MKGKDFEGLSPERVNLREDIKERMGELLELVEIGFFQVGNRYSLEQFLPDPEGWLSLEEDQRQALVKELGDYLGVDLFNPPESKVKRRYQEEGKQPARVTVLETNSPFLEVHIMEYVDPQLGTRYDIVRVS